MPEPDEIAAVVLAAGASRRFGADKLLCPIELNGKTLPLIVHSLQPWLRAFRQVTVVVRPEAGDFCHAVGAALDTEALRIRWELSPETAQGMGRSLAAGVAANPDAAGWLVGLADMPMLPMSAIAAVRDAIVRDAALAAPFRNGRRGHPVGFAASYRDELLGLLGDVGARHLLERNAGEIVPVEIEDNGIFTDIDSFDDLQFLKNNQRGNQ